MRFKIVTLIILILSAFTVIFADSDFDSLFNDIATGSNEAEDNPLNITGEIEFRQDVPYKNINSFKEPLLRNRVTLSYTEKNVEVYTNWDVEIEDDKAKIIPEESYIKLSARDTVVKAGYIEYNWGFADKINPTNLLNSRDYTDPFEVEEIPSLSIFIEQYLSDNSIEMVYIPVKKDSTFSIDPLETISGTVTVTDRNPVEKAVLGGKINHYGSVDVSLSYIWDIDDLYSVKTLNQYSTELEYQRTHNIGLGIKTVIGMYGLWFEGNYSFRESSDKIEWIAGFDRSIGFEDQGTLNIQSFGSYIPDYSDKTMEDILDNTLQNESSELTMGVTGKISYAFLNSELKPELTTIYINYIDKDHELIFKPEVVYTPVDSLNFIVGGAIATEALEEKSRIYTAIEYAW